jgi:hypothetical protein
VKPIGRRYTALENGLTGSDVIKLTDDISAERSSLNDESRPVQAVDIVFIGSETGRLELR